MPVPPRYSRVDPWVISSNTEAEIAFLEAAFDARETPGSRMLGPDGRIRLRDPQGHLRWIHQRLEDVAVAKLGRRLADPSAQQAMTYVQQSLASELGPAP